MIELTVLSALIQHEYYRKKALPYIDKTYFRDEHYRLIIDAIKDFDIKYNEELTIFKLCTDISQLSTYKESIREEAILCVKSLIEPIECSQWTDTLLENFCKQQAIFVALVESIEITQDKSKIHRIDEIPGKLADALSISFEQDVGYDYFSDVGNRYDYFNKLEEDKIKFDLYYLDKITKNGLPPKTLNLVVALPGGGKSIFLCNHAVNSIKAGKNVLYITLEMSAEVIAKRIDANLLDIGIEELYNKPRDQFIGLMEKLKGKNYGQLCIKEYPMCGGNANNFRTVMRDLRHKKNFVPDIVIIDYLNICAPIRSSGTNSGSYNVVKNVAEELRAFATEFNVPVLSAVQLNRGGTNVEEPDMSHLADSFAIGMIADFIMALTTNEEMNSKQQILCVQIKNRYSDINEQKKFVLNLNKNKMRFSDVEETLSNHMKIIKQESLELDSSVVTIQDKSNKSLFRQII